MQNISPESLQLIANLINDKNEDLKKHVSDQIRMVKTTVQENHAVSIEARDFGKKTNGRVTRLEDEVYGYRDKNGDKIINRDGILSDLNKIKSWNWLYGDWKVPVLIFVLTTAFYIKESRDFIFKIIDKIL